MKEASSCLHQLRHQGFKVAVVTSSQNCDAVLKATKLDACFEVRVDGNTVHATPGRSPPRIHSSAAQRLEVEPTRAVVVEDALL